MHDTHGTLNAASLDGVQLDPEDLLSGAPQDLEWLHYDTTYFDGNWEEEYSGDESDEDSLSDDDVDSDSDDRGQPTLSERLSSRAKQNDWKHPPARDDAERAYKDILTILRALGWSTSSHSCGFSSIRNHL